MMKSSDLDYLSDGSDIKQRLQTVISSISLECTKLNEVVDRLEDERFTADSYTIEHLYDIVDTISEISGEIEKVLNGEMF